jgi:nicotinamidase-related amidase
MNKLLLIIDMQNDFIDGALANPAAKAIVPGIAHLAKYWEGSIGITLDTHRPNYLNTQEGAYLPVEHCIIDTDGHKLNSDIEAAIRSRINYTVMKGAFGFDQWRIYGFDKHFDEVVVVGTCTDICVVSNVLAIKAAYPELKVTVIENLCAGLSPEKHAAAIEVMRSCQVNIV